VVKLGRDAQPLEYFTGPRLEAVAVEADDEVLHLGVAIAIEMLG
jgi:hypothetical protein